MRVILTDELFGQFGLKIGPLCFWNYETKAQELTSGAQIEGYEGYFIRWIWWSILTFFKIFDISPLWIDKFRWNWWPNWRVFDALIESGKIFDQYDPQNFWETLEAGAKKWIFSPFWLLWSENLGTSETEKDKKFMGKLNYSSRSNQWCNRHVNMLKHIDLAELLGSQWPKNVI